MRPSRSCRPLGILLTATLAWSVATTLPATLPPDATVGDTFALKAGIRSPGAPLDGQPPERGGRNWETTGSVVIAPGGGAVTVDAPDAAMGLIPLPDAEHALTVSGDVQPRGSGFIALALLPDKSPGDFWKTAGVWVMIVANGDYAVYAHGADKLLHKGLVSDYPLRPGAFNHVALYCDPASHTVRVTVNDTVLLPDTVVPDLPPLVCAAFRFNETITPKVPELTNFAVTLAKPVRKLTASDPRQFYPRPDQPATLRWEYPASTGAPTQAAIVRDYAGATVAQLPVRASQPGVCEVTATLPRGYYTIAFPETGQEFGIFATPEISGARDPFFGMDAAISSLVPRERHAALIAVESRLGLACARERLSWNAISRGPDRWDWQTGRRLDDARQAYARAGVGVLEMAIGTPGWIAPDAAGCYPRDLAGTAKSWGGVGQHWGGVWQGLEIWNEPDLSSGGNEPADQYVPVVKAIRAGLRAAHVETPVVGGVFAYFNRNYLDLAARNGLLTESDAISFHYYGEASDLAARVADYRGWLRDHGRGAAPLWITEIGPPWEGTPGTRTPAALDAHRAVAFARNAAEARACGVARIFPFVLPDYSEHGLKNFGLLDPAGTPLRALATYAEAIRELSGSRYLGDLKGAPGVRVFARGDGTAVVVLPTQANAAVTAKPFPVVAMRGIDGRTVAGPQAGDGLTYVIANAADFADEKGLIEHDTPAAALLAQAGAPDTRPGPPASVVLTPLVAGGGILNTSRGYQLAEGMTTVQVRVRATNLGPTPATLQLNFAEDGPGSGSNAPAAEPLGSAALTVGPGVAAEGSADLRLDRLHLDEAGLYHVRITAGDGVTPVAVNLIAQRGLQEQLATHPYRFALPIAELNRWRQNSAGHETLSKTENGGWVDEETFPVGDHWSYPRFTPPQEVDLDRVTAVLVRARCRAAASVKIMTWDAQDKSSFTSSAVVPADDEWHVALVPLADFINAPDGKPVGRQVREISVGMNSEAVTNRLEVSDLYLLGR